MADWTQEQCGRLESEHEQIPVQINGCRLNTAHHTPPEVHHAPDVTPELLIKFRKTISFQHIYGDVLHLLPQGDVLHLHAQSNV